jgi:hypothetical protein
MSILHSKYVVLAVSAAFAAVIVGGAWALHLGPFASADRGPVIATVDGRPIYLSEARYRVAGLSTAHGGGLEALGEAWPDQVMRSLVDDKIILHEAEEFGLSISEQEIASEILRLQQLFPDLTGYQEWLASQDMDEDELERRIMLQSLTLRVYEAVTGDVTLGEETLLAYYETHADEFLTSEGSPAPFEEVRSTIEAQLAGAEKDAAYAAWLEARRGEVSVVILTDGWWRSIDDGQQS